MPITAANITLVVACALVDSDGRVLVAARPSGKSMAGLWAACLAPLSFASHAYDEFHLLMPLYVCRKWDGQIAPREGQETQWLRPRDLFDLPMPPADKPLIAALRDAV